MPDKRKNTKTKNVKKSNILGININDIPSSSLRKESWVQLKESYKFLKNEKIYSRQVNNDMSRLLWTLHQDDAKTLEMMIVSGVDINQFSRKYGCHYLELALANKKTQIIEALNKHPDIYLNSVAIDGMTIMHLAAFYGRKDIIELLLEHQDININTVSNMGFTPLLCAAFGEHRDIVELLLTNPKLNVNLGDHAVIPPFLGVIVST